MFSSPFRLFFSFKSRVATLPSSIKRRGSERRTTKQQETLRRRITSQVRDSHSLINCLFQASHMKGKVATQNRVVESEQTISHLHHLFVSASRPFVFSFSFKDFSWRGQREREIHRRQCQTLPVLVLGFKTDWLHLNDHVILPRQDRMREEGNIRTSTEDESNK